MFKILGFLKMTVTLAYVLEQYRVQFLRFKKQQHAICSFLGLNHFFVAVIKYPNRSNLEGKGHYSCS